MKRLGYLNLGRGESFVEYIIFKEIFCVFTGVTNNGTSTVNGAERIIKVITETEGRQFSFYDLQTQKGYSYYKPGEYSFDHLIVKDGEVARWMPDVPPAEVLNAFKDHIGPNPRVRGN